MSCPNRTFLTISGKKFELTEDGVPVTQNVHLVRLDIAPAINNVIPK